MRRNKPSQSKEAAPQTGEFLHHCPCPCPCPCEILFHHSGITYTVYSILFKKMFQIMAPMVPQPYTITGKLHL